MSAQSFEATLARLYTDPTFRMQFLAEPEQTLASCDLTVQERTDLIAIDKAGLIMAARSFLHKRKKYSKGRNKIARIMFLLKRATNRLETTR